jgi:Ca2+-binding EF-hand superfamily protein
MAEVSPTSAELDDHQRAATHGTNNPSFASAVQGPTAESAFQSAPLQADQLAVELREGPFAQGNGEYEWRIENERPRYDSCFKKLKPRDGTLTGEQAMSTFRQTGCNTQDLYEIWNLVDTNQDGLLNSHEFAVHLYICEQTAAGKPVPKSIPAHARPLARRNPPSAAKKEQDDWFLTAFDAVDTDKSGFLEYGEMKAICKYLGVHVSICCMLSVLVVAVCT